MKTNKQMSIIFANMSIKSTTRCSKTMTRLDFFYSVEKCLCKFSNSTEEIILQLCSIKPLSR